MKLRWMIAILLMSTPAVPAIAQTDSPQTPAMDGAITTGPGDPALKTNSSLQPQELLRAYDEQMVMVTVQTYTELMQISQAARLGQISSQEAEYLSRRSYELAVIRIQFLDTLHQITTVNFPREDTRAKQDDQAPSVETSGEALVVVPPIPSSEISESVAKYLELTPAQIALLQARVTQEEKEVQPMLQQLSQNREALATATRAQPPSDSQIKKLAAERSHLLERLIIANSRLQRDIYEILNVPQRKKLDDMGQGAADASRKLFAQR